jgi:hypothetical protein
MVSDEGPDMSVASPLGVRRVILGCGIWCIVAGSACYVLGVSVIAMQQGSMHVRLLSLERAMDVDYAKASEIVGHDVKDFAPLRRWVIDDMLRGVEVVIWAASAAFVVIGVVCLVCAAKLQRYCTAATRTVGQQPDS